MPHNKKLLLIILGVLIAITAGFFVLGDWLPTTIHWPIMRSFDDSYTDGAEVILEACPSLHIECVEDKLVYMAENFGAQLAMQALGDIGRKKVNILDSGYYLGRVIGSAQGVSAGISLEAFSGCPTWEEFGSCQHGFLQHAIETNNNIRLEHYCDEFTSAPFAQINKILCYHGIGTAYYIKYNQDLPSALSQCLQFNIDDFARMCMGGAFSQFFISGNQKINSSSGLACSDFNGDALHLCVMYNRQFLPLKPNQITVESACVESEGLVDENCAMGFGRKISMQYLFPLYERPLLRSTLVSMIISSCRLHGGISDACLFGAFDVIATRNEDGLSILKDLCSQPIGRLQNACYRALGTLITVISDDGKFLENFCNEIHSPFRSECIYFIENPFISTQPINGDFQ